ncbi:MAG: hypothetical protein WA130_12755 [Candidatus Methanoperedens sp.]
MPMLKKTIEEDRSLWEKIKIDFFNQLKRIYRQVRVNFGTSYPNILKEIFGDKLQYFQIYLFRRPNNLQALGRKKNGEIAQGNFQRADELLNMTPGSNNATGFINNNITQLFGLNGTAPRNVTSFTVYGRTIDQVAIVNSTNTINYTSVENSTFITGILLIIMKLAYLQRSGTKAMFISLWS